MFNRAFLFAPVVALAIILQFCAVAHAQVTTPPTINGGNPIGVNFLGGTTTNTQNLGSLSGLGLNQGETFTFTGQPAGSALWNSGFSFLNNQVLQFQADGSSLPANPVNYEINFTDAVYGLQFRMSGLDNGDETVITFFNNSVPVLVTVSTYVNGTVTVPRAGNIIAFAGTNIDIDPAGSGFRADGDGNNDTGGITIHGLQEGFTINLPLNVAVDEVRLSSTGKNNGANGNVTLILTDFAWARPAIALTKGSSFSQGGNGESNVNDLITYTYTVENTGNVPLTDIALTETGFTGSGTTPVPAFSSGTGGATPSNLPQGESLTYTVTYPVTAADLLAGFIDNQGTVAAMPDGSISDLSDSTNPGDGGVAGSPNEDDVTRTTFPGPIVFNPSVEAVKTSDASGFSAPVTVGDSISYEITVTNTGDVDLSGITLNDTLTNGNATVLSPPAPVFISSTAGSPAGSLVVGESATYQFSYTLTQADIDSGSLSNTVTVNANAFTGGTVSDISDDGDDGDGNTSDDPTVNALTAAPSMDIAKVADVTTNVTLGQVITYTYTVTNTGNVTITSVNLDDIHNANGPDVIPGSETLATPGGIPISATTSDAVFNGIWDSLGPGDIVEFIGQYTVLQADIDQLQ